MGSFESRQSPPKLESDKGWLVQVYGSDRRLLCILEPIHGWVFLMGCGFGVLLALMLMGAGGDRPALDRPPTVESAPLQID